MSFADDRTDTPAEKEYPESAHDAVADGVTSGAKEPGKAIAGK